MKIKERLMYWWEELCDFVDRWIDPFLCILAILISLATIYIRIFHPLKKTETAPATEIREEAQQEKSEWRQQTDTVSIDDLR